jgi:hypothetical protein
MQLDIESIFSHHPPKDSLVVSRHSAVRMAVKEAAHIFDEVVPDSPEKTLAIRKLQEAMMYANSAIAQYSE